MNKPTTSTTGRTICRVTLAAFVSIMVGCRTGVCRHSQGVLSPAAHNSIAMNAGFRETTWTTLDGIDELESPVLYDQIEEDWYLYQDSETVFEPIEQVRHEVPAEFTTIRFRNAKPASAETVSPEPRNECVSPGENQSVAYFENSSKSSSGLESVDIEYVP